jgi:hypothetical protein
MSEQNLSSHPQQPVTETVPSEETISIPVSASTEAVTEASPAETQPAATDETEDSTETTTDADATATAVCPHRLNWAKVRRYGALAVSFFLFLLSIVLILTYIWGDGSRHEFQADCTDTMYWAEAAMQGNGLINPDFDYAALMPLGGNLFMQLWIPFFGVTMCSQALGMTTFFLALTAALFWLFSEMKWSLSWKCTTIGILLMGLSASVKLREIFWGHIIYYSLGVLMLIIGLCLVLHLYRLQEQPQTPVVRRKTLLFLALLLVAFVIFCTNSGAVLTLFALPLIAALFCERFFDGEVPLTSKQNRLPLLMLVLGVIGLGMGMLLAKWLVGDVVAGYASAYSHFSGTEDWWSHIEKLPVEFLLLLGLEVDTAEALMSLSGAKIILLLVSTGLIVALPVAALVSYRKIRETGLRLLIWSHWVSTLLLLVGYICGILSSANWRLSPLFVTGFLVSVSYLHWLYQQTSAQRVGAILMVPIGVNCLWGGLSITQIPDVQSDSEQLADFLQQQGLTYGYATFWNCQTITMLSDSQCQVRNVSIDENGVFVNTYQSNTHWYEDQPDQENYFLLMSASEKEQLSSSSSALLTTEHTELECIGYSIWVYEENIF